MTIDEFKRALADDLEISHARADDILNAISDLCVAQLEKNERINLPFGQFSLRPLAKKDIDGNHTAIRFIAAKPVRDRLKLAAPIIQAGDLCIKCQKRPMKIHRQRYCAACKEKQYRAAKKNATINR